jgi:hypothetical protein
MQTCAHVNLAAVAIATVSVSGGVAQQALATAGGFDLGEASEATG